MKFEKTEVMNFEGSFRGLRNPMESWSNADSIYYDMLDFDKNGVYRRSFTIGENDMKLAQRLIKAGKDHRKFMRQIIVSVDITAPMYWWSEFDTYGVGVVKNSTSKMHKLATTPITEQRFEIDLSTLDKDLKLNAGKIWGDTITTLEAVRNLYLETKDKRIWKFLIQLLPESWLQTRTVTMNYENLISIAHSDRKNHKLTEWCESFFDWMHTLPYADELIFIKIPDVYTFKKSLADISDNFDVIIKNLDASGNSDIARFIENENKKIKQLLEEK